MRPAAASAGIISGRSGILINIISRAAMPIIALKRLKVVSIANLVARVDRKVTSSARRLSASSYVGVYKAINREKAKYRRGLVSGN